MMTPQQTLARTVSMQLNRLQKSGLGTSGALLQARLLASSAAYKDVIKVNKQTGRITITTKKSLQEKAAAVAKRLQKTKGYTTAVARESQKVAEEKRIEWEKKHGLTEGESKLFRELTKINVVRHALKEKTIPSAELVPLIKAAAKGDLSEKTLALNALQDLYNTTKDEDLGDWLARYYTRDEEGANNTQY